MNSFKVLNSKFEEMGTVKTKSNYLQESINLPVVHQVVKSILANKRQGTSCTKNKALVRGGGKKPFKQKGTGRARQGSSRSPLMVGGGTAFGPTPRSYWQKINKKMMQKAFESVLTDKIYAEKLIILDAIKSTGKTKEMHELLKNRVDTSALFVVNSPDSLVLRAARNLKTSSAISIDYLNVYEILKYEYLIIEKEAFVRMDEKVGCSNE